MLKYIPAAAVVFFLIKGWNSWRFSKRLFAGSHYAEVAEKHFEVKELALNRMTALDDGDVDSDTISSDLATSCSISIKGQDRFHDHLATSTTSRPTLHATGDRFFYYAARVPGLPIERLRPGSSQTSVHHGKITINAAEQKITQIAPKGSILRGNPGNHERA